MEQVDTLFTTPVWIGFYALFGLVFGSFLNVVVARVPERESLNTRSACPKCGHQIAAFDNIPILSWLLLKAKCRSCKKPISWRYPVVEAVTAVAFGGLAWFFDMRAPGVLDITLLAVAFLSLALALIDWDTMLLPDPLVLALTVVVGVGFTLVAFQQGDWEAWRTAAIAAVAYLLFYGSLWWFTKGRGLGFGDVKLAPALGFFAGFYGVDSAVVGFVAAFVISGIPLGILLLTRIMPRGTKVPFGPFLILGAWIGVFLGEIVSNAYLSATGIS